MTVAAALVAAALVAAAVAAAVVAAVIFPYCYLCGMKLLAIEPDCTTMQLASPS